jgi:hypothetical protein
METLLGKAIPLIREATKKPLGVLSLVIVFGSALACFLFADTSEYVRLVAFVVLLVVFVTMVLTIARAGALALPSQQEPGDRFLEWETIRTRESLYNRLEQLIGEARQEVLDTTWGPPPPKLATEEESAQNAYLLARKKAVTVKKGFRYKELFTVSGKDHVRTDRFRKSVNDSQQNNAYQVRRLMGYPNAKPLPDFTVFDKEIVIVSHFDANSQFLLIRCKPLAQLFAEWFDECWRRAKECPAEEATQMSEGG